MYQYIKASFRSITILFFISLATYAFYELSLTDTNVSLNIYGAQFYTTQNFLILVTLLVYYFIFKLFGFILRIYKFFIELKIYIHTVGSDVLYGVSRFFRLTKTKEYNIISKILYLKRKKLYRKALAITSENYMISKDILLIHFILLLKLGKKSAFLSVFSQCPAGKAIPIFERIYLSSRSDWRRNLLAKSLYESNKNSQIFTYIYCHNLYKNAKYIAAFSVLSSFMRENRIFMEDAYCTYKMSLLAIHLENKISGSSDFAQEYIENINNYHAAIAKRTKR